MRSILSEIQSFARVNFSTNSFDEISVTDYAVFVMIYFIKNLLVLLVWKIEAPVFELKGELTIADRALGKTIDLTKGFSNCVPLLPNFSFDPGKQILFFSQELACNFQIFTLSSLMYKQIDIVWRIFPWIVPKVETSWLLNRSAHPLTELAIIERNFARIGTVLGHDLLKVPTVYF